MLDLTLFRKPTFAGASIVAFSLSASMFAMFLYITLYLQNILGYSPLERVCASCRSGCLVLRRAAAGRLAERFPERVLFGVGLALVGVGLLLMGGIDANDGWTALLPASSSRGVGIGMINPPLAATAVGVVPPQQAGMGSGINSTFRQVGIATGIAGLGAMFQGWCNKIPDVPGEVLAAGNPALVRRVPTRSTWPPTRARCRRCS